MNCDDVTALQAAWVDGQVDGLRVFALRRHLAGCPACAERQATALSLQTRLRTELPRYPAPISLRQRVADGAGRTVPVARRGPTAAFGGASLTGRLGAGVAGLVVGAALTSLCWWALPAVDGWNTTRTLPTRLVDLHTSATLANRLIDVASSDRHTVKPWLSARLDYSPPVFDAADAGFALLGARIARLDGRDLAVLVYRHRQHLIDVVVRPGASAAATAPQVVRGFNLVSASGAEMQWLAVSDLNRAELADFLRRLAAGHFQD